MSDPAEELQQCFNDEDVAKCVQYFRGKSEQQRQSVAAACLAANRKQKNNSAIAAALLAACSFSDLKKLGWRARCGHEAAYEILADRRPPWIDQWVAALLDEEYCWAWWQFVRQLVRNEICAKPDHPNYILGMIRGLVGMTDVGKDGIAGWLLADKELLQDEVWRLFEHEGAGDNSLANHARSEHSGNWAKSLVALSQQGHLDRERLLDASLDALGRGFSDHRSKWFSSFHDALQPTDDERLARAERYLDLLSSSAPSTAAWAFEKIESLDKQKCFDDQALIENLSPLFRSSTKGLVKSVLKLLDRIVERAGNEEISALAVSAAAEGMIHEATEVQNLVFERIEALGDPANESLVNHLSRMRDLVAPSCRKRLDAWLATSSASPAVNKSAEPTKKAASKKAASEKSGATPASESISANDLQKSLKKVDPELVRLAGLSGFVNEKSGKELLAAVEFDGTDIPRLDPQRAITRIETLDELIDTAARCIEEPGLVDEAERVLDGLSRLCAERPADFQARVDPLLHRVKRLLKTKVFPFAGYGPDDDVCGTVYAWITGEVLALTSGYRSPMNEAMRGEAKHVERSVLGFLSRRSLCLAKRLAAQEARPLLSAPTHAGGFIDPLALTQRVQQWVDDDATPDIEDVILALLRLAPEHRAEALEQIPKHKAEWVQATKYALGASSIKVGETAALWVAAARARSPWHDDAAVEAGHPNLGPDASAAARYEWRGYMMDDKWPMLRIDVSPRSSGRVDGQLVTVLFHQRDTTFNSSEVGGHTAGTVRWVATVWPLAMEAMCAAGALRISFNTDWAEAEWRNKHYLEGLLHADVPMRPMALLLLAVALAAKEPGEHGLAVDIAVQAIDDGRLDSNLLGDILRALLSTKWAKPARWAKTLAEVARVSPLHAWVVRMAIERAVNVAPDPVPRDLNTLLELLLELSIEAADAIHDVGCREYLSTLRGSNKSAQAAKKLLALTPDPAAVQNLWNDVCERAKAQRLQRLERWTGRNLR